MDNDKYFTKVEKKMAREERQRLIDEDTIIVSKSEIKRDAKMLMQKADELCGLTNEKLSTLDLAPEIIEAIDKAKNMEKQAYKRQLKFIGKLLRNYDFDEISARLAQTTVQTDAQKLFLFKIENLRDLFLTDENQAFEQLGQINQDFDRSHLRTLLRQHKKEQAKAVPNLKYYREIFQILKNIYTS